MKQIMFNPRKKKNSEIFQGFEPSHDIFLLF